MYDIFVSYASEDWERVKFIVKELKKLGWRVFIDKDISPGRNWPSEIKKALEDTRCVLVVWTTSSVNFEQHPFVRDEAASGLKRGILVPLRLDSVELPLGFCSVQTADLSDCKNISAHPEFLRCVEAVSAIMKIKEDLQESHTDNQMMFWHHLDKQSMKQTFKRLWYKKTMVNVFLIERNPEAYSYHLHSILETYCCREFETVCSVKGGMFDHLDISYAEDEFARYMARYFDINISPKQNFENVQSGILNTQVHFIVQSIDDFSYTNFKKYYELWVALEPKKQLFLFFHVKPGSLAEVIEPLENYCFCRYHDHEEVGGDAFQDFFSDPKSPLKNHHPDICNSPPMTFQQAVKVLEFCLKEP